MGSRHGFSRGRRGRSFRSTFESAEGWWRPNILPDNWTIREYQPDNLDSNSAPHRHRHEKPEYTEDPIPSPSPEDHVPAEPSKKPLRILGVDMRVEENTKEHHTDEYEATQGEGGTKQDLILRRGQPFLLDLHLDRPYIRKQDKLMVILKTGKDPRISKDTLIRMKVKKNLKTGHWSAAIDGSDDQTVTVSILTSANCIVGKWGLLVTTTLKTKSEEEKLIMSYSHPDELYILFNPWCREDEVFLDNDEELDECIMNEFGKIFSGNYKQIGAKPWNFGQFEDDILECCLFLLEQSGLSINVRGNVNDVVRAISGIVNSPDDGGVLVGNWSGDYSGGTSPSSWVGSVAILEEYFKTKKPVKYGQCWVFSGVCTTVCRALGIPCRSVTNFSSAHDCDGSMTIDVHWNKDGEPIDSWNEDSVWNFHVWNEAWMSRPDLPSGYGGWQAFDATPQETSGGLYCAGPCSVSAIRMGHVHLPHDGKFIFSEVNADRVSWIAEANGEFRKVFEKSKIGKKISTQRPHNEKLPEKEELSDFHRAIRNLRADDPDRKDVTLEYKFKEGTEEERAAVYRANTWSTRPGIYNFGEEDVTFEVKQKDEILVGNGFDVVLRCQNKSREERNVFVSVHLSTMYYTGVVKSQVKKQMFDVTLGSIKAEDCVMHIAPEEYLHLMVDQVSFKINVLARVQETSQVFAGDEVYRLRRPDLVLEAPSSVALKEEFKCTIQFSNSLPMHLKGCEWMVEGPGIQKTLRQKERDLDPYETAEITVTLKAWRRGKRQIMASFQSNELMDVTGMVNIKIKKE